jgi:hypothetical protein
MQPLESFGMVMSLNFGTNIIKKNYERSQI